MEGVLILNMDLLSLTVMFLPAPLSLDSWDVLATIMAFLTALCHIKELIPQQRKYNEELTSRSIIPPCPEATDLIKSGVAY